MIHARNDYRRIQDPAAAAGASDLAEGSTPIGIDEPVFLLRAQDRHFVPMLEKYAELVAGDDDLGSTARAEMLESVRAHIALAGAWQNINGRKVKSPDIPRRR